jgi:site-specific DNA-methyltransferase (adenine-specific)/adenine-specific DNA-methyltransferase
LKAILDETFGESNFRNEIIWKRQSAHSDSSKCGAIHDTILFYTKAQDWVWNEVLTPPSPDYVEQFFDQVEPGTNRRYARGDLSAGGLSGGGYRYKYKGIDHIWRCPMETLRKYDTEGRIHWPKQGVPRLKRYLDEFRGVPLQDVWTDIRVIHNQSDERVGYPTQKPESLIDRIMRVSSGRGDLVLDAFVGSGTTCAIAEKLGRRWIGIDCGKLAIYTIQKRMMDLRQEIGNKGPKLNPKPFTLYNAGLYAFSKLKELPWEDWRFFALQLFQCRNERHKIGGIEFDGYRQGASVLVFDHMKHKDARITEETIQEIHEAVGSRVGSRVFIVAPALTFDFQQDYIDFKPVRYFALRIPYSIIHELHRREFTALKQPSDEMAVNDTVEAVGFYFIRTPELKYKTGKEKRKGELFEYGFIKIETFKSDAVVREPFRKKGNLETLSMVMLDFDYEEENKIFNLDEVHYADAIEKDDWKVRFGLERLGKKMMAVFLDIYGNEAKVLIEAADFGKGAVRKNGKRK